MAEVEEGFTPHVEPGADASPEPEVEETVEAEAEAEAEESEGESPPPVEQNDEEKSNPFQERIDKLTENWRKTERALTDLEKENEELRRKVTEIPTQTEEVKTLADFDYDDKAYQQYVFDRAEKRAEAAAEKFLQKTSQTARVDESVEKFEKSAQAFAKEHTDYYEVVQDKTLRISEPMAEVIRASEIGPELAYYLGKNPDVAKEISAKSDAAVGRELALLETQLQAKQPKKVSKAPPPPPANIGGGEPGQKVSSTDPKSDKLSDAEWFKLEEKRLAKLRG